MPRIIAGVVLAVLVVIGCAEVAQPGSPTPARSVPQPSTSRTNAAPIDASGTSLGKPGTYGVGFVLFDTVDSSRGDRSVQVLAHYPALTSSTTTESGAAPDASGAPYAVVVTDGDLGPVMGPHLASHGFVTLTVQGQHSWGFTMSADMIDFPLDQRIALDALEAQAGPPLAGLADTSRSAAIGYSFGAWDALMLAGARVDPDHYSRTCASRPAGWSDNWWGYICGSADAWEAIVARAEEVGIARDDGLWESMGDSRIRAVMPMGPEGFDLIGPAGLADVQVPALLIAAGNDSGNDYDPATTSLFAHYPDAELITFVGADHLMVLQRDAVEQMKRFVTAFLGYRLQGHAGDGQFLTEGFVEQVAPLLGEHESFETLVWGVAGNE
jgi:predicted dienelactone hydrolase